MSGLRVKSLRRENTDCAHPLHPEGERIVIAAMTFVCLARMYPTGKHHGFSTNIWLLDG